MICIALYAPSSPQRLVDAARAIFGSGIVDLLVVIKPVGMAAQVGLAEVSKVAYKRGKNLVILSQLSEVRDVLNLNKVFILVHDSDAKLLREAVGAVNQGDRLCVVIQGSEVSIPKAELVQAEPVRHSLPEIGVNPVADVALVLYELRSLAPRT
ncbi:MAG: hypothetical protein GXO32_04030 [Crenarchaeota archaeon]|nr:hypothetical protein [Thermoproteota archaeon]